MRWCIDGHKVNFARGKIPSGGKKSRKCIYSAPGQESVVFVSFCLCLLGNHLGGGSVERSDSYVCLSVCLRVHDTLFRCVYLFEVPSELNNFDIRTLYAD